MKQDDTKFQEWWREKRPELGELNEIQKNIALQAWYAGAQWCLEVMQQQLHETKDVMGGDDDYTLPNEVLRRNLPEH